MFNSKERKALTLQGTIPGAPREEADLLRTRIYQLVGDLAKNHRLGPFQLVLRYGEISTPAAGPSSNTNAHARGRTEPSAPADSSPEFVAMEPNYQLGQLVLPAGTMERLMDCISFVEVAPLVFDTWGLRAVEPHPSIAVNFRGPPGTGKTMAAHVAASHLKKKILSSRLSDLESKYHGQGPKNLAALFNSARDGNAIVFIDEAESLLSRRFAQPEQAAESAINSMRTELLMALDSFDGLVIFASNLPHSYDTAIESRLLHVDFGLPDLQGRYAIWKSHLPATLPLDKHISLDRLAAIDGVSGRDIKLAVISAAVGAARRKARVITEDLLISSLERQRTDRSTENAKLGIQDQDVAGEIKARLRSAPSSLPR